MVYQFCSNDDHRLTFDLLRQGQICVSIYLYGGKIEKKNHFFFNTCLRLMAETYNV